MKIKSFAVVIAGILTFSYDLLSQENLDDLEGIQTLQNPDGRTRLTGKIQRASDRKQIEKFLQRNPSVKDETQLSDGASKFILARLQEKIRNLGLSIRVKARGKTFILSGAGSTEAMEALSEIYPDLRLAEEAGSSKTSAGIQPTIYLEVILVEVKKTALRALGPRLDSAVSLSLSGQFEFLQNSAKSVIAGSDPIRLFLDLALRKGEARIHAKQSLVTENGKEAQLHIGGQFAIRVSGHQSGSVIFKDYGLLLRFTPSLKDAHNVHLQIFSEMSDLDFQNAVDGIPTILKKVVQTQLFAHLNEMVAIGGLVRSDQATLVRGVPGLSEIPGLGRLFRSDSFLKEKSAAFIFIAPRKMDRPWLPSPEF